MEDGIITMIAGPVVKAENMFGAKMYDVVKVGQDGLIGEIIGLEGEHATIQVYEETTGVSPGEHVVKTGMPLSVELGPGLATQIYDGIQRPLPLIKNKTGDFITRGVDIPPLDHTKKWQFTPTVQQGTTVSGGDIIGTVPETVIEKDGKTETIIEHRIMIPHETEGTIESIVPKGQYTIDDTVATVKTADGLKNIAMLRK